MTLHPSVWSEVRLKPQNIFEKQILSRVHAAVSDRVREALAERDLTVARISFRVEDEIRKAVP